MQRKNYFLTTELRIVRNDFDSLIYIRSSWSINNASLYQLINRMQDQLHFQPSVNQAEKYIIVCLIEQRRILQIIPRIDSNV